MRASAVEGVEMGKSLKSKTWAAEGSQKAAEKGKEAPTTEFVVVTCGRRKR